MTIDILCATFNGAQFLPDFRQSLEAQTHSDWRLWVRDDGSTDNTVTVVRDWSQADPRVRLAWAAGQGERLGAARSFGWLLDRTRSDVSYVMFADQDDVWLPQKITQTFAAMRAGEAAYGNSVPLLVHTDLTVTDASLRTVHPSFWTYARIRPEPTTLRRLISHNVTTGSTMMMNQRLTELIGRPPAQMAMHDWWCACVAAAFGRVIALPESTVLYRQHASNAIGAHDNRLSITEVPRAIAARSGTTTEFRRGLNKAAVQADAFLTRYGDVLSGTDRAFLDAYARIPQRGFVRRKLDLLRYRVLPERGLLHTLGVLWRG